MKRDKNFRKEKRRMTKILQRINKQLREDVFGTRFEVRAFRFDIMTYFDGSKTLMYSIEITDNKTGEKEQQWYCTDWELNHSWRIFTMINDFIIESDFWETRKKQIQQ